MGSIGLRPSRCSPARPNRPRGGAGAVACVDVFMGTSVRSRVWRTSGPDRRPPELPVARPPAHRYGPVITSWAERVTRRGRNVNGCREIGGGGLGQAGRSPGTGGRRRTAMASADAIVKGLGGAGNIVEVEGCITRLRTEVRDPSLVDEAALRADGAHAVIIAGTVVQVVVGPEADMLADDVQDLL